MTEALWLVSDDSTPMLELLGNRASDRKLRLLFCGWVRRFWHQLTFQGSRNAVEVAERFADGQDSPSALENAGEAASAAFDLADEAASQGRTTQVFVAATSMAYVVTMHDNPYWLSEMMESVQDLTALLSAGQHTPATDNTESVDRSRVAERVAHADLIRDIIGNPFRPVTVDSSWLAWNGGTIPTLAQAVYGERELPNGHLDLVRLALLADMLEDAGCTNADILDHLRSPGPHVRGCWVIDLLLDKH